MNTQKLLTWPQNDALHLNCSDANMATPLTLDQVESFSAWIDQQGDSLAAPTSFDEWLRQSDDSLE
jgi:hypothetical protein